METYRTNGAFFLMNKPLGWTSFDVVKKIRHALQIDKIGHAGTLDPLATGLLIVCTGPKTKTIYQYQEMKKVYTGQFVIGKTTPSMDLETAFDSETSYSHIHSSNIIHLAQTFVGNVLQIPPAYSAVKINGNRAYQKARKGEQFTLQPRPVTIEDFTITSIDLPRVNFAVTCSKGTYIRSLVRDMGAKLGVGAYLSQLCRTHIGPYALQDALEITNLINPHGQFQIHSLHATSPSTAQSISQDAIDVLDEKGNPTGEALSRKEIHQLGKLHRSIHLYLFDQANNLLLQKRSSYVDSCPNMFNISVTGHVDAGENSCEAVVRELQEELGLDPHRVKMEFLLSLKKKVQWRMDYIDYQINDIYVGWATFTLDDIVFDQEEISEVKLVPFGMFESILQKYNEPLAPIYKEEYGWLVSLLNDV